MKNPSPFLSRLDKDLQNLLLNRAGNNRPVLKNKSVFDPTSGVSGLSPWIRITSAVKLENQETVGGLVMDSVRPFNTFGNKYGNTERPGIIGYQLDLKTPVTTSTNGRGLRPSPIISSVNITEQKGYRDISFSVTTFTLEQLDEITKYFMEPGFHILCEWGWNIPQSRREIIGAGAEIDPNEIAKCDNWAHVLEKRKNSDFTYDVAIGMIVGGDISMGDDETYTLNVKTKSIGNVPEYMQTHRSAINSTPTNDSTETNKEILDSDRARNFSPGLVKDWAKDGELGKSLFAQLFNSLPENKKITQVRDLYEDPNCIDLGNFVNFDKKVREDLLDAFEEGKNLRSGTGDDIKLPKDAPIFSENRFIRFELAHKIISAYNIGLKPQKTSESTDKETRDLTINIEDTVISGHPHMFSTDPSKLFIPNTKAPNFKFVDALRNPDDAEKINQFVDLNNLDKNENLANIHPLVSKTEEQFTEREKLNGSSKDYLTGGIRPVPYAFPCTYELNNDVKPVTNIDETYIPLKEDPYFWGWLKDLYINFDFFVECISKDNYLTRDVYFEMLNGMSTACNSIWHFELREMPNLDNGDLRTEIVDSNFTGILDEEVLDFTKEVEFTPTGKDSPFLSFGIDAAMPSAQLNNILLKNMDDSITPNSEEPIDPTLLVGSVFAKSEDKVGSILLKQKTKKDLTDDEEQKEGDSTVNKSDTTEGNENILFDFLIERGSLFPRIQDRNAKTDIVRNWYEFRDNGVFSENDTLIEDLLFVGTWKDSKLLKTIFEIDNARGVAGDIKSSTTTKKSVNRNTPYGTVNINFTVHGVSGFKFGSRMKFKNLPTKFTRNLFYSVETIEHKIDTEQWLVDIKLGSRAFREDV